MSLALRGTGIARGNVGTNGNCVDTLIFSISFVRLFLNPVSKVNFVSSTQVFVLSRYNGAIIAAQYVSSL